ncbi:MAG: noncanonical pyrimidine nucleotidase, YjjG family [Flavobacteriales bacterium]|nr:noncanonical pyrimidine nucleotidase, YjjG family [Flavobacteriales bacterium]
MKKYRHIFFDLDHTLWDLRTNSRETLHELFIELDLERSGVPDADALITVYEDINADLWRRYEAGRIPKEVLRVLRFRNTLMSFGVTGSRSAERLAHEFLERCPRKGRLNPGVLALLDALIPHHALHVITNGSLEVQQVKLRSSGISDLFQVVLTSEQAAAAKPDPRIFHKALDLAGASAGESLMVGDDPRNDIEGARGVGMDQAHYVVAPEESPASGSTYRFAHFDELRDLLQRS